MTDVLRVDGLYKNYGDVKAVRGVSLAVAPGEVVALLGPNGGGKTTTIRCIAGLLRADSGIISVNGFDLQRQYRDARRQFSYLPQQAQFPAQLTVREIAVFHASLRGLGRDSADKALLACGLAESAFERTSGQLSGGMRQRLALALSSLGDPDLMLFDEPTANLDPQGALDFRVTAAKWRDDGRAILLSTHVLADVEALASRVIVLVDGAPVADEPVARLRSRLSRTARLRINVGNPQPAHVEAALAAGALDASLNCQSVLVTGCGTERMEILDRFRSIGPVLDFDTERPTLEDVYVQYLKGAEEADNEEE
ncbi:MAG: ABC transporter ATP-binding protein [Planctomycetales bacterium]|nr:ABC transporter ATP-binding protein [bacterium]MCB1221645.1 ABC transporter ATP-binding protein [bacterium]UNM08218.1 MAG: ABC transporter ATP-binding protein [Planctomycetales bacterium]